MSLRPSPCNLYPACLLLACRRSQTPPENLGPRRACISMTVPRKTRPRGEMARVSKTGVHNNDRHIDLDNCAVSATFYFADATSDSIWQQTSNARRRRNRTQHTKKTPTEGWLSDSEMSNRAVSMTMSHNVRRLLFISLKDVKFHHFHLLSYFYPHSP